MLMRRREEEFFFFFFPLASLKGNHGMQLTSPAALPTRAFTRIDATMHGELDDTMLARTRNNPFVFVRCKCPSVAEPGSKSIYGEVR
jgi:hypothetical protein